VESGPRLFGRGRNILFARGCAAVYRDLVHRIYLWPLVGGKSRQRPFLLPTTSRLSPARTAFDHDSTRASATIAAMPAATTAMTVPRAGPGGDGHGNEVIGRLFGRYTICAICARSEFFRGSWRGWPIPETGPIIWGNQPVGNLEKPALQSHGREALATPQSRDGRHRGADQTGYHVISDAVERFPFVECHGLELYAGAVILQEVIVTN
jgi:hypothetical protein